MNNLFQHINESDNSCPFVSIGDEDDDHYHDDEVDKNKNATSRIHSDNNIDDIIPLPVDINTFIVKRYIESILIDNSIHIEFRNLPIKIISILINMDTKILVDIILIVNVDFKCSTEFIKCSFEIMDMIEFYFDNTIIKNPQSLPMIYNIHEQLTIVRNEMNTLKDSSEKTGSTEY